MKYYIILMVVLLGSCEGNENNFCSTWLLKNEKAMNSEITKIYIADLVVDIADTNWDERTIVITEYDSTILGKFVRLAKLRSNCIEVNFTYFLLKDKKRVITLITDSLDCQSGEFDCTDDSKYFYIKQNQQDL